MRRGHESGVMMIMALGLLGILWFMVLGFSRSSVQSLKLATTNLSSERALLAAEAGLVFVTKKLAADQTYRPPTTYTKLTNSPETFLVSYLEGSKAPVALPDGAVYLLSIGRDRSGLQRQVGSVVKLTAAKKSLLNFAIFSNSLSLNGGSAIDSYDSTKGTWSIGDDATVGTNSSAPGSIDMAAGTYIQGEIKVGPKGVVGEARPSTPTTRSDNTVWKNWSAWSKTESKLEQAVDYPEVAAPAAGTKNVTVKWSGADIAPGSYRDLKANGGGEVRLTGGTYVFRSIKLTGGAKLSVSGSQPVTIYVTESLDMSNGTVYNTSQKAANLNFMMARGAEAKLTGGANAFMVVYGPEASITMSGGTNLYGAVVSNDISMTGGARIHYDVDLAKNPPSILNGGSSSSAGLTVISWQQL